MLVSLHLRVLFAGRANINRVTFLSDVGLLKLYMIVAEAFSIYVPILKSAILITSTMII